MRDIGPSQFPRSTMSDEHRRLVIKLAGGDARTFPLIHSMEHLPRRDIIYRWLFRNGITGEKLFSFFEERKFSWASVASDVLKRVEKVDKRPLIMGKDVL